MRSKLFVDLLIGVGESEINNPWTGVRAFHIILFGICESGGQNSTISLH